MIEESQDPKAKLPYHAPELRTHGDLREITQGSGGSTFNYTDSPSAYVS